MDVNYLSESILFQLQIGSKVCNFISLNRSPSQTTDNFDSFLDNLKLNLHAMTDNNCDGVMLEIYYDHKFHWPQEGLNYESLAYEVVT